jgi:hypothetical protein
MGPMHPGCIRMHPYASGFYLDAARCRRSSKSCRNMHWMHSPKVETLEMSFVDSLTLENPKSIGRKKKKKKKKKKIKKMPNTYVERSAFLRRRS